MTYNKTELLKALKSIDNVLENGAFYELDKPNIIMLTKHIDSLPDDIGEFSDGFHTFNELYFQRVILFSALVKVYQKYAWKSKRHEDGKLCFDSENWFIVGITTPLGDYTYHYEMRYWDLFDCQELEKAPKWDGHTSKDVTRLLTLKAYRPRIESNGKYYCPSCKTIISLIYDYCPLCGQQVRKDKE